jgi:hypothetical protein
MTSYLAKQVPVAVGLFMSSFAGRMNITPTFIKPKIWSQLQFLADQARMRTV